MIPFLKKNPETVRKKIKSGWLVFLIAIGILLFTNPSIKRFKDFLGEDGYYGMRKKINLGVASVYSYRGEIYLGVGWNFIYLKEDPDYKYESNRRFLNHK